MDSDNAYIKNLILRNIYKTKGIFDLTKEYMISKCQNDVNFVVRTVCEEENRKNSKICYIVLVFQNIERI